MTPETQRNRAQLTVWWIVWAAILGSLLLVSLFLGRSPFKVSEGKDLLLNLAGVVPLFLSIVIRWLVLPRLTSLTAAFPMFVAGLALGEACGLLGIFLGGPLHDALALLGVLAVVQYMPFFARGLVEPKGSGFIPNN